MDSEIFKTLAGILVTLIIAGIPTIAEGLKRRAKARKAAAMRPRRPAAQPIPHSEPPHADHRQAMARTAEIEAARTASAPPAPTPPPAETTAETTSPPVSDRIAALRRAVIAAEVLQRRF